MTLALVLILAVALVLLAALLVQRGARRRLAARGQWRSFGEQLAAHERADRALADSDAGIVTYRQVAELLPRNIVEDVERALEGRRPVLEPDPEPYRVRKVRLPAGAFGGYSRVIVHHPNGTADVIGDVGRSVADTIRIMQGSAAEGR